MDYYNEPVNGPYAPSPAKKGKHTYAGPEDTYVTLKEKVFIPVDEHPGYNFIGSIIGPSGSILKTLQRTCDAKISIYGKGSMRDKKKEEELAIGDDSEHAHLKEPLHVLIEVKGPRAEAYWRMSNALPEIYKFMTPSPKEPSHGAVDGGYAGGYDYGFDGTYEGYGDYMQAVQAPMQAGRGFVHGAPHGGIQRGVGQRGGRPTSRGARW